MKCDSCLKDMVRKEGAHIITYTCPSCLNVIKIESRKYDTTNLISIIKSQIEAINSKRHLYLE